MQTCLHTVAVKRNLLLIWHSIIFVFLTHKVIKIYITLNIFFFFYIFRGLSKVNIKMNKIHRCVLKFLILKCQHFEHKS